MSKMLWFKLLYFTHNLKSFTLSATEMGGRVEFLCHYFCIPRRFLSIRPSTSVNSSNQTAINILIHYWRLQRKGSGMNGLRFSFQQLTANVPETFAKHGKWLISTNRWRVEFTKPLKPDMPYESLITFFRGRYLIRISSRAALKCLEQQLTGSFIHLKNHLS